MNNESFYFPRNERKVLLAVIVLVVLVGGLFFYVGTRFSYTGVDDTDSVRAVHGDYGQVHTNVSSYYHVEGERVERFCFDPNTADSTTLLRLGLRPWQVRNIYRYRAKGGVYRQPSDFARLYGLTAKEYKELEPYIRIEGDYRPASSVYGSEEVPSAYSRDTLRYPVKLREGQHIVLNHADTTELKKVPGIGSAWARAIVAYGNRLGGYCRVSQLLEIEGFPESALPYFKVEHPVIAKLKVNTASVSKLRQHPYVNFYQARAIYDHVRKNGPLKDIRELSLLPEFPQREIERLAPYLSYE